MPAHPNPTTPKHIKAAKSHASTSNVQMNGTKGQSNNQDQVGNDYEFDLSAPTEVHRVPADQLTNLTEEQKNEVFTKTITAADPNVKKGAARFDYVEGVYKPLQTVNQLVVHFQMDGSLIHNDSEEAKEQMHWIDVNKDRMLEFRSAGTDTNNDQSTNQGTEADGPMSPVARTHEIETSTDPVPVNDRALKNQFNYSERGNQTINPLYRDREIGTEPPPCVEFGGQVTHWEIFDTYALQLEREVSIRAAQDKPKKKLHDDEDDDEPSGTQGEVEFARQIASNPMNSDNESLRRAELNAILHSESCVLALKTMERLINQNSEAAAFYDYKYSDEPASVNQSTNASVPTSLSLSSSVNQLNTQQSKGSFLPLWKFSYAPAAGLTVTAITFNPTFPDLFAVSYGSFEFGARVGCGYICCYTLKNAAFPEYILKTEQAVQCLNWHPAHPSLLAAGYMDGSVAVYDIRHAARTSQSNKNSKPALLYISDEPRAKHTDCVWQVAWQAVAPPESAEQQSKPLSFASIAADGRVTQWTLNKQELQHEDIVRLTVAIDERSTAPSGGTCFAFNSYTPAMLLVGTEEGAIHLYDRAFHTSKVRSYVGHHASVYALHFNPMHPGVFLSCSADWQVKVWEIESETPVMSFDLACPIGDCAWSPHCSTMFAVVTTDGRLRVYDLAVNKYEPVSELRIHKRVALTHVAFSNVDPLVAVGDAEGRVQLLKLSASIRRKPWPESGAMSSADALEQVRRLDRLLVLPSRSEGRMPTYIKQFIANREREQAGEAKAIAEAKAAQEKAKAAAASATSPLTSPRKQAD